MSKLGYLEDSRVRHTNLSIPETHPRFAFQRCYCVVCGKPDGWVSMESYALIAAGNVICVCNDCHETCGNLQLPEAHLE